MKIQYRKSFSKQYKKLSVEKRMSVDETIALFRKNPHKKELYNHALKGKMKGLRSIAAGFDLRIVFREKDGYTEVIMISVGGHDQVYV